MFYLLISKNLSELTRSNLKVHKYILINMKASLQFRLWAASISHCQEHSTCTPTFFRWKKCPLSREFSVTYQWFSWVDIFLSPVSTHWTEWEIRLLSRTTKSLRHLFCTMKSAGLALWNSLLRKGNISLLSPENHCLCYNNDARSIPRVPPQT